MDNNKQEKPKVILTCFAGRRRNMDILLAYADKLHSMGLIDEMHIWNFTKNKKDEEWLLKTFQKAPIMSLSSYNYEKTNVKLSPGKTIRLALKCKKDAHMLLTNQSGEQVAEISLGAYNNSCSFLRAKRQGETIAYYGGSSCDGREWKFVEITVESDGMTTVSMGGKQILRDVLPSVNKFPLELSVAGWEGGEEIKYLLPDESECNRAHPYARLFHVKHKGFWSEYYNHYMNSLYDNHVIIKSDDDIVFIDVDSFERFIEQRINEKDALLLFPNIVNNGLCAGHQYDMGYLDKELGEFRKEGTFGKLWGDGRLCTNLHKYFVKNHTNWMNKSKGETKLEWLPIGHRISINFFAILSKDLFAYQMIGPDDERDITINVTKKLNRRNLITMNMTVSHLSFYKQRETGLNESEVLSMYKNLLQSTHTKERSQNADLQPRQRIFL